MPLDNLAEMAGYLIDVASVDPLSAFLVLIGNAILLFSLGVFGVLVLGAVVAVFTPD